MISVVSNISSLRAQRNLNKTSDALTQNINRLSSGLRINRAGDDAAGSAISSQMTAYEQGLKQASRNSNDGVSLIQTAEGALNEMTGIVQRMRELAVQASNEGTMDGTERGYLDQEFQLLESELDRIVNVTEYNGQKLVDGSVSTGVSFQVGMKNTANDRISVSIANSGSTSLGLNDELLSSSTGAQKAITALDTALQTINTSRGTLGATQNRLEMTMSNLAIMHENMAAGNSRIKDVDVAEESAAMSRNQILSQAGTSVLAQANQLPQSALSLIG
ncbi:MAG: flagellin FliC [Deltaproteobacteria bacterium]|jgi:flagellin|nr:flagellin FliC [Deltaproteobacteria bacterium]